MQCLFLFDDRYPPPPPPSPPQNPDFSGKNPKNPPRIAALFFKISTFPGGPPGNPIFGLFFGSF